MVPGGSGDRTPYPSVGSARRFGWHAWPVTDPEPLRIYTDGACSGNPGPGGWAWASSADHTGSGGDTATTNNRMELTAVLRAIEDNPGRRLVVVMDSTYVKDGLEKWSKNWVRNDWRTKDKQPVKNQEIWKPLLAVRDSRPDVRFEWVKGHSGDRMNDLVDELAVRQRDAHRAAAGGAAAPSSGGGKLADLPIEEQRAERRRRDGRIPDGHLLLVVGHGPAELGGWDANPTADDVRRRLGDLFDGYARIHPDLVVMTGLRPGAEQLAAEAAIRADVPYVAILPFPDPDRSLSSDARGRFQDLVGRAREVVQLEKKSPSGKDEFAKAMRRRDVWLTTAADQAILVWDQVDNRLDRLFSDLDTRLGPELTVLLP
jgi:ribonuclease HI